MLMTKKMTKEELLEVLSSIVVVSIEENNRILAERTLKNIEGKV